MANQLSAQGKLLAQETELLSLKTPPAQEKVYKSYTAKQSDFACYYCGFWGHLMRECWKRER